MNSSTTSVSNTSSSSSGYYIAPRVDSNKTPTILPKGYRPTEYDVICGRGRGHYNQPGNKRFRSLITSYLPEYQTLKNKMDKSVFFNKIIDVVRSQIRGNVHFIRQISCDTWETLNDDQAREKVGHAIRESLSPRNRQLKSALHRDAIVDDSTSVSYDDEKSTLSSTSLHSKTKMPRSSKTKDMTIEATPDTTTSLFRHSTDKILSNVMDLFDSNDCSLDPIPVTPSTTPDAPSVAFPSLSAASFLEKNKASSLECVTPTSMIATVSDVSLLVPPPSPTLSSTNTNHAMWMEFQSHKKVSNKTDLLLDDEDDEGEDDDDGQYYMDNCEPVSIEGLDYSVSMTLAGLLRQVSHRRSFLRSTSFNSEI
jgi:hypothetical protein